MISPRVVVITLLAFVGAANAAPLTPQQLYAAGKYEAAIESGSAQKTAEGLAVGAHAALAEATLLAPCLDCVLRAEALARQAIALNPKLAEGHLYLAVALGYEARIRGAVVARLHGLVGEAKRNLDAALAADPQNARVLAALGGWNVAIVNRGGRALARLLYGASLSEGLTDFSRAFALAPQDIALRYQYALSLAGYDAAQYRKEIGTALARAAHGKPATAYDSVTQTRAEGLLRLLNARDDDGFQRAVRRYQGYPDGAATDSPKSRGE